MLFFIGAIAGLAYGLSAFGGGLVAVPLLFVVLDTHLATAMTMNLCMLIVLATITAGDGVRARLPVPGIIWPFALVTALAAPVGILLSVAVGIKALNLLYLLTCVAMAVALLVLGYQCKPALIWPRGGLAALHALKPSTLAPPVIPLRLPFLGGVPTGLFTGIFGSGGNVFLLPALGRILKPVPGQAVACAELAVLPGLVTATVTALLLERSLDWQATGLMIFGALAGLSLARMLTPWLKPVYSNAVVAVFLLLLAGAMVMPKV